LERRGRERAIFCKNLSLLEFFFQSNPNSKFLKEICQLVYFLTLVTGYEQQAQGIFVEVSSISKQNIPICCFIFKTSCCKCCQQTQRRLIELSQAKF